MKYIPFLFLIVPAIASGQTSSIQEDVTFLQNTDGFVIMERKPQSNGALLVTYSRYPKDLIATMSCYSGDAVGVKNLANKNIINSPVETYQAINTGTSEKIIGAQLYTFYPSSPYPKELFRIESQIPISAFSSYHSVGCSLVKDPAYKLQETYTAYDNYGNLLEKQVESKKVSYMYGYKSTYKIATVENAANNQIAYTSFETNGEQGFWSYDEAYIAEIAPTSTTIPMFGKKVYSLTGSSITRSVPLGKYIVSFWQQSGSPSVGGGSGSTVVSSISGPSTATGWTYREYTIDNTNWISLVGPGIIDELRLYPANALMETVGYYPLIGMSYSCDMSNHVSYYTYDDLGRLVTVRDHNNNVIKKMEYGIQKTRISLIPIKNSFLCDRY